METERETERKRETERGTGEGERDCLKRKSWWHCPFPGRHCHMLT